MAGWEALAMMQREGHTRATDIEVVSWRVSSCLVFPNVQLKNSCDAVYKGLWLARRLQPSFV